MRHDFRMDSGILQVFILYILPVQFLTHAFTECEPAVCLLVVFLQIMVTFSKLHEQRLSHFVKGGRAAATYRPQFTDHFTNLCPCWHKQDTICVFDTHDPSAPNIRLNFTYYCVLVPLTAASRNDAYRSG